MHGRGEPVPAQQQQQQAEEGPDSFGGEHAMKSYPMLPGSIMHYAEASRPFIIDMSRFTETERRWRELSEAGLKRTVSTECPIFINFPAILVPLTQQEDKIAAAKHALIVDQRKLAAQKSFTELVISHTEKDIIGFWNRHYPKKRTLDAIANHHPLAFVLCPEPHPQMAFNYHWDELGVPGSRFEKQIAMAPVLHRAIATQLGVGPAQYGGGPGIGTIYMVDFTPARIKTLRARFPTTRLVGITTPTTGKDDDEAIMATFAKLQQQK